MSDALLEVLSGGVEVFDLGRPLFVGMPQSPNHPAFTHSLPRRHGDMVRSDGGSAANDIIVMGTHVGTHIDALAHVSHQGLLHGGVDATEASRGGRFMEMGIHTVKPMVCRGILLDVAGHLGQDILPGGYEISPDELEATAKAQGTDPRPGDVLLVRSGWGANFSQGVAAYTGGASGVPGVGEAGAYWLAGHAPLAVGADTIAFERLAPGSGHSLLPAHRVLLVERGIYIIEAMELDKLAAARRHEFTFVLSPLAITGATGSPVRPLALVAAGE